MPIAIKINPKDNVVVALHPIAKGTAVPVDNTTVTAIEDIPQGHKMAIAPIKSGENVIKYGFPIGHATADAVPGTWMHTHNIHTNLSGEIEYSYHPNVHPLTPAAPDTFMGYRRKDGRAAQRDLDHPDCRLRQRLRQGARARQSGPCDRQHRRAVHLHPSVRLLPDRP